jgi:hypothetical protein
MILLVRMKIQRHVRQCLKVGYPKFDGLQSIFTVKLPVWKKKTCFQTPTCDHKLNNFPASGCGAAPIGGNHRKGHRHRFHMWPSPSFTCHDTTAALRWNGVSEHQTLRPRWFTSMLFILSQYIYISLYMSIYIPMIIMHYLGLMNKFMFPLSLSLFGAPLPRTAQIDNKNRWGQSLQLSCMGFKSPMYRINLDPSNDIPHRPFSNTIYWFFVKLHERLALSLSNIYILWSLQHPRCIASVSNPLEHPSSHHRQPRLGSTKASAAR